MPWEKKKQLWAEKEVLKQQKQKQTLGMKYK